MGEQADLENDAYEIYVEGGGEKSFDEWFETESFKAIPPEADDIGTEAEKKYKRVSEKFATKELKKQGYSVEKVNPFHMDENENYPVFEHPELKGYPDYKVWKKQKKPFYVEVKSKKAQNHYTKNQMQVFPELVEKRELILLAIVDTDNLQLADDEDLTSLTVIYESKKTICWKEWKTKKILKKPSDLVGY